MKNLIFITTLSFVLICQSCKNDNNNAESLSQEKNPYHIDLADGFYYLNGVGVKYAVYRDNGGMEIYNLNPSPIFIKSDFKSIDVVDEENGNYSLSFELNDDVKYKWDEVLASSVHYIGFVNNNRMKNLLKIKGENARNDVYLSCVSVSEADAKEIKQHLID